MKPEVLSSDEGVQVESASRMDYDRSKWMRASAKELVDPDKSDAEFMRCLLQLLRKVRPPLPLSPIPTCYAGHAGVIYMLQPWANKQAA